MVGPLYQVILTPPLVKCSVDLNPKSEMAISRQFSMNFSNRIDESNRFFKAFQMVVTIGARTSKIAPRSSRYPPGSRSTFREGGVKHCSKLSAIQYSQSCAMVNHAAVQTARSTCGFVGAAPAPTSLPQDLHGLEDL